MMPFLALLAIAIEPPSVEAPVTQPLHDAVTAAIRNCPLPKDGEIAVCARDRGFSEKYRIERLTKPSASFEDPKLSLSGVANTGSTIPGGCTSASAIGTNGCSKRDYDDWAAWKRKQKADGQGFPW